MESAIEVRRLSKLFGRRPVLKDLDFAIAAGSSVALCGVNGSGKTTLLGCLAALIRPTAGEVRWFGQCPANDRHARRLIGMVAHESRLYPHLSLHENLLFAARMYGLPQPGRRADDWLEQCGLQACRHRTPPETSKGVRQRLALARAMIHDPPILLLDEPFAGLDAEGSQWLYGLLGEHRRRGRTVCFAEHDFGRVRQLADRALELTLAQVREREPALAGEASPSPCRQRAA